MEATARVHNVKKQLVKFILVLNYHYLIHCKTGNAVLSVIHMIKFLFCKFVNSREGIPTCSSIIL